MVAALLRRTDIAAVEEKPVQLMAKMETYQSCVVPTSEQLCEDELYNILETMSPFDVAHTINEVVEFCQRCKSAPCGCGKSMKMYFGKRSSR